ncbi:MAG: class I SAM-dependent methyltransferase, partial [Solirubrobacteraceae bacterium]
APPIGAALARAARATGPHDRVIDLDPHTKICLYAVRAQPAVPGEAEPLVRVPKRRAPQPSPEEAVFADLQVLGRARRLTDWMFAQYRSEVHGLVAEVGAGIGTYTERILAGGAREVLALEPEPACAAALERRFAGDPRVTVARDTLPAAPVLAARAGEVDLVVCQNVLEHIDAQGAAVTSMAAALVPGGHLALIVPAHPRLFGPLDRIYGHHRRYTAAGLRRLLSDAELEVDELHAFNLLGVPGWWFKNRRAGAQIGPASLRAYEALAGLWRPLEERVRPPWGLSLVALARRPG